MKLIKRHATALPPLPERNVALFLDIDGTLTEIAATPSQTRIASEILTLLQSLQRRTQGALALISGRTIADIDRLCNPIRFAAVGQHGLEIRYRDGDNQITSDKSHIIEAIGKKITLFHRAHPQLLVEYKSMSIAVHYRTSPPLEDKVKQFLAECVAPYDKIVCVHEGNMVGEIKLCDADKGVAIRTMMQRPPFNEKMPLFAGNDQSDEQAFATVNALHGLTVKVGAGKTQAMYQVGNVAELQEWLYEIDTMLAKSV